MKRFTETSKWNDPWFRKLSPKMKCLWLYICDLCDAAGVIELDLELAGAFIGQKLTERDMSAFDGRLEKLPRGKLWIRQFVYFQYGTLSEDCRPHKVVFEAIRKAGMTYPFNTLSDTLPARVSNGVSDTPQEQDKEKDKEQDKTARRRKMTMEECCAYAVEIGLPSSDGAACFAKWEGNGWKNGGSPIADVKATMRSWKAQGYMPSQKLGVTPNGSRATL